MNLPSEISALGRFGTGLSQHPRLLTLAGAQDGSLPESLVVERFGGREGINAPFGVDVDALSVSTDLDLAGFIGTELTVGLCTAGRALPSVNYSPIIHRCASTSTSRSRWNETFKEVLKTNG